MITRAQVANRRRIGAMRSCFQGGNMTGRHLGQKQLLSALGALALVLLMASATKAVAVNDDGDDTRQATQEFNFRIGGPDQRQQPSTAPRQAEILFRANRLPNTGPKIGVACPTQVHPEFPRRAQMMGIESVVTAQIRVRNGVVQEVIIVEGDPVFDAAVTRAIMQYKCVSKPDEGIATQTFNFKLS